MLSVMCPNCRHRFPAPGCCNPAGSVVMQSSGDQFSSCGGSYCTGSTTTDYLVPRGYLNGGGGCVINAPTIIHGATIINGQNESGFNTKHWIEAPKNTRVQFSNGEICDQGINNGIPSHCQIATTGGSNVTSINDKSGKDGAEPNLQSGIFQNPHPMLFPAPSGCQELPGSRGREGFNETRRASNTAFDFRITEDADWTKTKNVTWPTNPNTTTSSSNNLVPNIHLSSKNDATNQGTSSGTVIQVNATLQLPPNVAHCTVSITATANTLPNCNRTRNNFNGGGIVENDSIGNSLSQYSDRDENSPTTPVSWVLPFPWGVNGNTGNNSTDLERLSAAQRVLQISGWYHEGLSWQQSAALLKNAPVGYWLMRDSSDKRFMYAVSVQTARGPTAVRVHYVCGRFRLDAEPRMAPLMPMFECPVKMIEHYIEYSNKMSEQKEVWVDHSGQLYSQIYLTKPLLKEVRSLSHLARLAVNRANISTKDLPAPLREYIAEYPYTE